MHKILYAKDAPYLQFFGKSGLHVSVVGELPIGVIEKATQEPCISHVSHIWATYGLNSRLYKLRALSR